MKLSRSPSAPRLIGTTLLLTGLSLALSLELLAEEAEENALEYREDRAAVGESESQETKNSVELSSPNHSRKGTTGETVAATMLGTIGGMGASAIGGFVVCNVLAGRDYKDCRSHPAVFAGAVLGGVGSGYRGYKNGPLALVFGGVFSGGVLGAVSAEALDHSFPFYLGAASGGYLGYRLWRIRKPQAESYSLLPYWDEKRSGVLLSGRF